MNRTLCLLVSCVIFFPSFSRADLDLEQEVLTIPDTHNEKPYIWRVTRNPRDLDVDMKETGSGTFSLSMPSSIDNVHVFITDDDLHSFEHVRPTREAAGSYSFEFAPPQKQKYRFEIVFKTDTGWIAIGRSLKLSAGRPQQKAPPGDEDYAVKVKLIPRRSYAEHVTTFLYEISYKGRPLTGLDKIEGYDMHVAAWDEDLKDFIYAVPPQNLGGPEIAVPLVFMRPGRHAVFAEFSHNGVLRRIESAVDVLLEPRQGDSIENLMPSRD